ncbi:RNA-directed DNA polymerase, eukaryota, reverse transcriptase zinc-binding domain protein, partial [Tanacetum coccineum]
HGDKGDIMEDSNIASNTTWGAILSSVNHLKQKGTVLLVNNDSWQSALGASNGYTVASVRSLVDSNLLDSSPIATHWNRSIPIKVNVFIWRLSLNKLPSRVNLDRKGLDVGLILCPMCMDDVETVNHIFFSCNMAKTYGPCLPNGGSLTSRFVLKFQIGLSGLMLYILRIRPR